MKALLVINEKSGGVLSCGADHIVSLAERTVETIDDASLEIVAGDYAIIADEVEKASDADTIICAGGDGTQANIAAKLLYDRRALLPLPCGTMNLLSRDLGYSLDLEEALLEGFTSQSSTIDVGQIGDRIFLNNVVFGAYAALADAREELRDVDTLDDLSFGVVEAAHALVNADAIEYQIIIDDEGFSYKTNTVVVSNNEISGSDNFIPYRTRLDQGHLYTYLSDARNGAEFTSTLYSFLRGEHEASDRIDIRQSTTFQISADTDNFSYTVDGDPVETSEPVKIKMLAGALKVKAPTQ
ncbi:diacylglycerol kinase family protein [Hyphococcus flavus]|uniref:Diacylglycerol kinase family protein n=1 Tax=Hyphococcus flavus TaxID=1866326 RepID=A0AAE9ZID4_9PROT|nr:diacylglycerol kinase family protein [Hyphococcus flavus]WDI31506.1 diacylglycerol kinase family protein [Hyphococcus flavus]